MEPKNCKQCGKVFWGVSTAKFCPSCEQLEEEIYRKVREFLLEFPKSKADVVMNETGVSSKRLMRYLREGRIEISDEEQAFLTCMLCNKPITSGKYCKDCNKKQKDTIKTLFSKEPQSDSGEKMRFISKDYKKH